MSRALAISPIGTGAPRPRRASSARARPAYGDFVVMTSTGDPLYGMRMSVHRGLALWLPPLALMALYVLPKGHPISDKGRGAEPGHAGTKKDTQAELYEVPKKHN